MRQYGSHCQSYFWPNKNTATGDVLILVRHIDLSWNTLEPSLVLMHQKLTDLGWVYYNGEIHIVEPETEESKHHV